MAITGPNDDATQTLSARVYQVVFRDYKVGLGSAYGVVILVAVVAVATICVRYIDSLNRRQGKVEV
jgi:ABC-type sugar transport system permease subunit